VATRLRQAAATVGLPVRLVMARLTMAWTLAGRGRKASVAYGSWTVITRARELVSADGEVSAADAGSGPVASSVRKHQIANFKLQRSSEYQTPRRLFSAPGTRGLKFL